MKIYNNNPKFGDIGPFEAESYDSLANDLDDMFKGMAENTIAQWQYDEQDFEDMPTKEQIFKELRSEFISGLTYSS